MKKLIFTLLVTTSVFKIAFSQTKNTTELGINIGFNGATVITNQYTNTAYRNGFNIAGSVEHYFSDRWSIKGKLIYDQKGWNDGYFADGNKEYTSNYKFNYLTVPVMASWHFGRTRNWYLHFGPYTGFLLSASETALNTNLKSLSNGVDFGLATGIGVKFKVAEKAKFFLEADGQSGITDIFKNNTGSSIRNERTSINAGFTFSIQ